MLKREYAFVLIAVLLGLAGSIIIGEIVVRMTAPAWLEHRMSFLRSGHSLAGGELESDLSWPVDRIDGTFVRFKPNHQLRVATTEYQHIAHIDAFGGRTTCAGGGAVPSQSLAILGDSFTFGLGVEDCEAFASLLALERRESRVLNLGVPGSALPQQLFIVSKRQSEMRDAKTYLFFFFLGNDYADMINAKPYWWEVPEQRGDKKRSPVGGSSVPRRLLEYVNGLSHHKPFSYSYLLQFARAVVLRAHLGVRATSVDAVFKAMLFKDIEYLNAMRTALRVNLNYLRTLLGQTGAKVAIIAIPDRYQLLERIRKDQAEYYGINVDDLDRFIPNRILAQESASAGIPLLDPSDCLDNRADKVNFYYTNDNHFTKAGHKAFFDCIRGPVAVLLGDAR